MSGYYGTAIQQRLQRQTDRLYDWIYSTPGVCHQGRCIGTDDPSRLGWPAIFDILERDGVFGFRMLTTDYVPEVRARIAERGFRIDFWDLFHADAAASLAATRTVTERGCPDALREETPPADPASPQIRQIQALLADNGIAPMSGAMLAGAFGPAVTRALIDRGGGVVASAHAYFPHNAYSSYARWAWCGLVAVAGSRRGRGIGRYLNARVVAAAVEQLGASHVMQVVSADNTVSRRMVEAAGLRLDPTLKTAIAVAEGGRFTR